MQTRFYPLIWLLPLLLIGFWLRLAYARALVFHTDEYISMLAARMVAQQGVPILPSGLFYDHGLLYTYFSGLFVALLGFDEWHARWPVILTSLFTIAAYYFVARRLFASSAAGLVAAALYALSVLTIKWGVWARMYTLAHLFVLLSLYWLLVSTLKQPTTRGRYLFLLLLTAALFSHSLTLFILPPLGLLLLLFTVSYRRKWLAQSGVWLQALIGLLILGGTLWVISMGHVGSTISLRDPYADVPPPFGIEFLRGFFLPSFTYERFRPFIKFFFDSEEYRWLIPTLGLALLGSGYRLWHRQGSFRDVALLFLTLLPILVILEMGGLLTDDWRKRIYMFFLTLPAFLLIGAAGLTQALSWLVELVSARLGCQGSQTLPREALVAGIGLAIVFAFLGKSAWESVQGQTTGGFYSAFPLVQDEWQPGDKVMANHAAAAYLYLNQNDYYLNQVTAKVLPDPRDGSALIDRYTGSPLIETVAQFNQTLSSGERIWFVVGDEVLDDKFSHLLQQQIFSQMDLVRQSGEKYIFISRPFPSPVPQNPTHTLQANFSDQLQLAGYSLDVGRITPDGTTLLGLFWRPVGDYPSQRSKIFVQLRDAQNQTVSQADHFIFEGLLTAEKWQALQSDGEWLRDTAHLPIPLPLSPENGPYQVYVGLYNPDTFERVPLLNDTSNENAVVIDFPLP